LEAKKEIIMLRALMLFLALQGAQVFADQANHSFVVEFTNDEKETLIADEYNRTLYVFDNDLNKPASVCNGNCAETWPPYIVTAKEAATLTAPLGTLARANKSLQLTYLGRPLYLYAFDRAEGDDLGDGVGGVWHYIQIK
jgi:transforming growth factor-beta-induced protein